MPRGQPKRVALPRTQPEPSAEEETQPDVVWDAPASVDDSGIHPSILRLAVLAQRMADRCLRGKYGLALENDARETLDLWETLPEEYK